MARNRRFNVLVFGAVLVSSMLYLVGCTADPNDTTRTMMEASPVKVEAEQVMLSQGEVDCGIKLDLWGPAGAPNQGRSTCPLLPAGRALQFDDDVVYTEPGYHSSYIQVRGNFPLGVIEIVSTKDGPDKNTKVIEARVGIKVNNSCFPNPLPIMGIRKGQFTQDFPPALLYRIGDPWEMEKFIH